MTNSLLPEAETAVPVKSTQVMVAFAFAAGIHCSRKNCYMTNSLLPEAETAVPVQINTIK